MIFTGPQRFPLLPLLETLDVRSSTVVYTRGAGDSISQQPSLRHLCVGFGPATPAILSKATVNFLHAAYETSLTSLDFEQTSNYPGYSDAAYLMIAARLPHLRSIRRFFLSGEVKHSPVLSLPSLDSLHVVVASFGSLPLLLFLVKMPALKSLRITFNSSVSGAKRDVRTRVQGECATLGLLLLLAPLSGDSDAVRSDGAYA